MLGESISDIRGKVTGRRVLSTTPALKMEASVEASGTLLGIEVNEVATYWSEARPDGSLYAEGEGVFLTKDGQTATFKGQAVGKFGGGGAVSYRGTLYFSTASPKLARLNTVAGVFEYEVDANGNARGEIWEWK